MAQDDTSILESAAHKASTGVDSEGPPSKRYIIIFIVILFIIYGHTSLQRCRFPIDGSYEG